MTIPPTVLQSRGPNAKDLDVAIMNEDDINDQNFDLDDSCNLRPIIIDGSNVALR